LITVVIAVLAFWFIPSGPETARFLTEEEKAVAVDRLRVDSAGTSEGNGTRMKHVWQALSSVHVLGCGLGFFFGKYVRSKMLLFTNDLTHTLKHRRAMLLGLLSLHHQPDGLFRRTSTTPLRRPLRLRLHLLYLHWLPIGQIQEACYPDYCVCTIRCHWLLHARISATESASGEVWRALFGCYGVVFVSAALACLGELC